MICKRGRPCKVESEEISNTVMSYKDGIIVSNKVTSKYDNVWSVISSILHNQSPLSLYTIVTCNKHNIRNKLLSSLQDTNVTDKNETDNIDISNITDSNVTDSNVTASFSRHSDSEAINFTITISSEEFEKLVVYKLYKRMRAKKLRKKLWKTFRPGIWEDFLTSKIWEAARLK